MAHVLVAESVDGRRPSRSGSLGGVGHVERVEDAVTQEVAVGAAGEVFDEDAEQVVPAVAVASTIVPGANSSGRSTNTWSSCAGVGVPSELGEVAGRPRPR